MNQARIQGFQIGIALSVFLLVVCIVSWFPSYMNLSHPSADQVAEFVDILRSCHAGQFQSGWIGVNEVESSKGIFTTGWPMALVQWAGCRISQQHGNINPLQGFLIIGLVLTFFLATVACRSVGFHWTSSLLAAFFITTAPCAFSRLGHLSLATLWPVIPGLIACQRLWQSMSRKSLVGKSLVSGILAAGLCFPGHEYYTFFIVLMLAAIYFFALVLNPGKEMSIHDFFHILGGGAIFMAGFFIVLLIVYSPKFIALAQVGVPGSWSAPRYAIEQFSYGLLPFTWVVPSPWVEIFRRSLIEKGIEPSTESYFWSTGSFLIPLAWVMALRLLARPGGLESTGLVPETVAQDFRRKRLSENDVRFYAVLLGLVTFLGLLWMTMGGLGTLFAVFVTPVFRSLNRFTGFVYGASVLMVVATFDRYIYRRHA